MAKKSIHILLIFMLLSCTKVLGNSNNLQSNKSGFNQYQSLHFNIYYYEKDDSLAKSVLESALHFLPIIEEKVGYRLNGKLDLFLLHNTLEISNNFREFSSPNTQLNGGNTAIITNKIYLSIEQSHQEIINDLKKGIAENLIHEMLFGGTAHERIKYATLLHLPHWFTSGLANYIALDWNEDLDNQLRNALLHDHFKNINQLDKDQSTLLGHGLWRYIDQNKGENTIRRTLYSIRFSKKLENAFYFVFNQNSKRLTEEWLNYQLKTYLVNTEFLNPQKPELIPSKYKNQKIVHFELSPNANKIALTMYFQGIYEINIWDRDLEQMSNWYRVGVRSKNHKLTESQCLIKWKNNKELFLLVKNLKNSDYKTNIYLLNSKKTTLIDEVSQYRINSFDYNNKNSLAFCGQINKTSVIKELNLLTFKTKNIAYSNEYWTDISYSYQGNALLFTAEVPSNKSQNPTWQSDIKVLLRDHPDQITNITNTNNINEKNPLPISNSLISFLSDENGINNAFQFDLITEKKSAITNYKIGVLQQNVDPNYKNIIELIHTDHSDLVYVSENNIAKSSEIVKHNLTQYRLEKLEEKKNVKSTNIGSVIVESNAEFQVEFPEDFSWGEAEIKPSEVQNKRPDIFKVPFHNKLSIEKIVTQINNSNYLSDRYSPYLNPYQQLHLRYGLLFGVALSDLQNHNRLEWGIRTFPSFDRWDLQLNYTYQKNQWINSFNVWRQSNLVNNSNNYLKNIGSSLTYTLGKEMSPEWTILAKAKYRNEQFLELSTESSSLTTKSQFQRNYGAVLKMQYEQLFQERINSYQGMKAYLQVEQQQNFHSNQSFFEVKGDFRYGLPITKNLSFMNRLHFARSYGTGALLYFFGGVENSGSNNIKDLTFLMNNSSFYSPVYGLRGLPQNVRNGNSFAFLNSEIRWEAGNQLLKYTNSSQLLQNIMLIGFLDMGSAWYGKSPYSNDNPINTKQITTPVFDITLYNPQQPIVFGLGSGIRTKVYSYFIKYDIAKGWDNGVWGSTQHYFSLGKDF